MLGRQIDAEIIITNQIAEWNGGKFAEVRFDDLLHLNALPYVHGFRAFDFYGLKLRIVSQIAYSVRSNYVVMQECREARAQALMWRGIQWTEKHFVPLEARLLIRIGVIKGDGGLFPTWAISHHLLRFYFSTLFNENAID